MFNITSRTDILYFTWWALILLLTGLLIGRCITQIQRFTIGTIRASADYPQWYVTVIQAAAWTLTVVMWIIITLTIANKAGLPSSFISSLGALLGAGIGFGCQYVFRDIINGAIHLTEKMFIVGDYIALDAGGTHYEGTVEEISLRHITIATFGSVVHIPQGSIEEVENFSSGVGRLEVSFPVDASSDMGAVDGALRGMCDSVVSGTWDRGNPLLTGADREGLDQVVSLDYRGLSEVKNGVVVFTVVGVTGQGLGAGGKRGVVKLGVSALSDVGVRLASSASFKG